MKKASKQPGLIKDLLKSQLSQLRSKDDCEMASLFTTWQAIVDPATAEVSKAVGFNGGLLIVNVSNSTWLHHLTLTKPQLISTINKTLDKAMVTDIRFQIGSVT